MSQILKVSADSKPNLVAGAIAGYIKSGFEVDVVAIGPNAVNQGNKAIIIATSWLIQVGLFPKFLPSFVDLTIDGVTKVGVKWKISRQ